MADGESAAVEHLRIGGRPSDVLIIILPEFGYDIWRLGCGGGAKIDDERQSRGIYTKKCCHQGQDAFLLLEVDLLLRDQEPQT